MPHFRDGAGRYLGEFATKPPGDAVEVHVQPIDTVHQRWFGTSWQWPARYFRLENMTFAGAMAGPDSDKPEGWIEVSHAPNSIDDIWNGTEWVPPPASTE